MKRAPVPPLLYALIAVYFFGGMAVSGGRVAASLYALRIGTSESTVGILIALYGVLPMFFSLAAGRWADRAGPINPLRAGVVAVLLGTGLVAAFPGLPVLFVLASVCGIGFNLVTVSGQYAVGQLSKGGNGDRVAHFGWFSLGQSSANVVGPIVTGILIDRAGFTAAFSVLAACAGCALLCVLLNAGGLRALHAPRAGTAAPSGQKGTTLLGSARMRRIYFVGVMLSVSWDIFTFLMPILGFRAQLSASVIGVILAAFAGGTFSIRLIMPWFSRRFSEWQILSGSIVVIVLVYLALPLTQSVPVLMAIGYLFGMAVGCSQPNMLSLLHEMAPPNRGAEAVGLRQFFCNASGVVVPVLFGATAATLGVVPVFWGVAATMAMVLPAAHKEGKHMAASPAK